MIIKTIIYLDQNYLSNMAKAKLEFINNSDRLFWKDFHNSIKATVFRDSAIYPELEFQRKEARFNSRIYDTVCSIINEVSWDLYFNDPLNIAYNQILVSAFSFVGENPPPLESWRIPFNSDPHLPIADRMEETGGIFISYSPSGESIKEARNRKSQFKDKSINLLKRRQAKYGSISNSQSVIRSKQAVVDSLIGQLAVNNINEKAKDNAFLSKFTVLNDLHELHVLFKELNKIGIDIKDNKKAMAFADTLLDNCPFIDISGSIWAAITEYYKCGREPTGGDYYDSVILATVIPYCDIVTTDTFMKEILVKRFKFDKKYNCKIFSENKEDRERLKNIVANM